MSEIFLLDKEEVVLLIGSIFTLSFNSSFIFNFIKLFKSQINLIDIPILAIFLSYLNSVIWFIYSKYILHDIMKNIYLINIIISLTFIILFLICQYKKDKTDTILNILLIISITLSINKFLTKTLNDEDKIKFCCCYSIIALCFGILFNIFRAIRITSNTILNIYNGICLILVCGCHLFYGIFYKEIFFIISNFCGMVFGFGYLGFFYFLKINYTSLPFKELRKDSVIGIEVENDKNRKNDIEKK